MFIDLVLLFDVNTRAPLVNDVVHDGTHSNDVIYKGGPCVQDFSSGLHQVEYTAFQSSK